MDFQDLELAKAADVIARDLLVLKPGEDCVIVADSEADRRVVEATARAGHTLGADITIVWYKAPPEFGEKAVIPRSAAAAMSNTDVVIEFGGMPVLYSKTWEQFMATGKVRYLCLAGMDVGMAVRTIANVDFPLAMQLGDKLAELTRKAREMRITTPAGMDLNQKLDPNRPVDHDSGKAETPGAYFLGGQISWVPVEEETHGTMIFDGSVGPPLDIGILSAPIELTIEAGCITGIKGDRQAKAWEKWMASWDDPNMYKISHGCYGANPGAKLTGNMLEDERLFGSVEFGFGYQPALWGGWGGHGNPAKSHTDGLCLNPSVWLDGEQIEDDGKYIHPELVEICQALGK